MCRAAHHGAHSYLPPPGSPGVCAGDLAPLREEGQSCRPQRSAPRNPDPRVVGIPSDRDGGRRNPQQD